MLDGDAIIGLSESIYKAAIDPARWPDFIAEAQQCFGAAAFTLELAQKKTGAVRLESSLMLDADIIADYENEIFRSNPRVLLAHRAGVGSLCHDEMIAEETWRASQPYTEWLGQTGTRYSCWGKLCDTPTDIGFFSLHFEQHRGPLDQNVLHGANLFFPHIQNALAIIRALAVGEVWPSLTEIAEEGAGGSYALLASNGLILRLSSKMDSLLRQNDVLVYQNGQLKAKAAIEVHSLQRFVAESCFGEPRLTPQLPLRLRGLRQTRGVVLHAIPVPKVGNVFDLVRPAALVTAIDLDEPLAVKKATLRSVWGLTSREAELALLIARGHSIEQSAYRLGITNLTARHHLKSIFRRMEIERQADLVRLIAKLG